MKNPVLKDIRKTFEVSLPSYKGSKIILWDQLLAYQNAELQYAKNPYEAGLITLKYLIKEWNFVDEKDNPVKVTQEILSRFPSGDMTFLISKISELIIAGQNKKKMNSRKLSNPSSRKK